MADACPDGVPATVTIPVEPTRASRSLTGMAEPTARASPTVTPVPVLPLVSATRTGRVPGVGAPGDVPTVAPAVSALVDPVLGAVVAAPAGVATLTGVVTPAGAATLVGAAPAPGATDGAA